MAFKCVSLTFVQRQVFSALSQIAKHNVDLAEMVVEADIFPSVLTSLKDSDEYVKKNTATLIREIAKHTPEVGFFILLSFTRSYWGLWINDLYPISPNVNLSWFRLTTGMCLYNSKN